MGKERCIIPMVLNYARAFPAACCGESQFIFSGADVIFNDVNVNTNMRFTLFLHTQQHLNLDFNDRFGLFTGIAIRNVGFIVEDYYQ